MYDELIKQLRRCASYDPRFVIQDCEDAADAIEELLAEREENYTDSWKMAFEVERDTHRWISVTERLPEHSGDYLVYSVGGNWKQLSTIEIAFWNDKNFIVQSFFAVTHWMPLPESPKEDE